QEGHQGKFHSSALSNDGLAYFCVNARRRLRHNHRCRIVPAQRQRFEREQFSPVHCCTNHAVYLAPQSMKPSFKVGLVCAGIAAAIYGGYWAYSEAALANFEAPPIQPGKVTFVALNLGRD